VGSRIAATSCLQSTNVSHADLSRAYRRAAAICGRDNVLLFYYVDVPIVFPRRSYPRITSHVLLIDEYADQTRRKRARLTKRHTCNRYHTSNQRMLAARTCPALIDAERRSAVAICGGDDVLLFYYVDVPIVFPRRPYPKATSRALRIDEYADQARRKRARLTKRHTCNRYRSAILPTTHCRAATNNAPDTSTNPALGYRRRRTLRRRPWCTNRFGDPRAGSARSLRPGHRTGIRRLRSLRGLARPGNR